jgi:DNA mismatch repair ATPase MutS
LLGSGGEVNVAMGWAFAEEFLTKSAFTFLATHIHYLTNLESIFTNVTK